MLWNVVNSPNTHQSEDQPKQPTTNMSSHEVVPHSRRKRRSLFGGWGYTGMAEATNVTVCRDDGGGKVSDRKIFCSMKFWPLATKDSCGGTVQACTRGIRVCKHFLLVGTGVPMFVMDTEGIDALDVESSHDIRIFALAVLLGSIFCFNSKDHIDEAAIQTWRGSPLLWRRWNIILQCTGYCAIFNWKWWMNTGKNESWIISWTCIDSSIFCKCATRDAIKTLSPTRHCNPPPTP